MRKAHYLLWFILFCASINGYSATVTESWLRQAGISCGGGLSVELQGQIDAAVIRRLKIGSILGKGKYQISDTENLLKQFQQEEKRDSYIEYVNCLITLMEMAANTSQLPAREVLLNSPIAVASIETIKRGQRFVMIPGDSVAIKSHALTFTVNLITGNIKNNNIRVYFNWSNSETGQGQNNAYRLQSQLIRFEDKCALVPYKIDPKDQQVSFISNC